MSDEAALRQHLDALGVPYEIIPCDPALADTAAFCAAYGYPLEDSANTIVVVARRSAPATRRASCWPPPA
jgi:hypothetical protein